MEKKTKYHALRSILSLTLLLCLSLFMLSAYPLQVLATEQVEHVTTNQLIEQSWHYDQRTIRIEGEVIGEVLERGDYGWINVNDGTNTLGVWAPLSVLNQLQTFGDYAHHGDTVAIIGVYSRACTDHDGDIDIHLKTLTVIEKGYLTPHPVNSHKVIFVAVLFPITLLLLLYLTRFKSRFTSVVH